MLFKILLSLSLVLSFNATTHHAQPHLVEGKVVSESSNKPIARVYTYIIEGEEEALTDANGRFRIQTWQKFPLTLTVKYRDRPAIRVQVNDASVQPCIRIKD